MGANAVLNLTQGWRQEFSDGGADSSDEGGKIWFSGYYKRQKSPKKLLSTFRRGTIAPLAHPWRHLDIGLALGGAIAVLHPT